MPGYIRPCSVSLATFLCFLYGFSLDPLRLPLRGSQVVGGILGGIGNRYYYGMAWYGLPISCHTIPCQAMPHHTTHCNPMRCQTITYNSISCHAIPYSAMPCNAIPYHAIRYLAIPCHAIPCHLIVYNAKGMEFHNHFKG